MALKDILSQVAGQFIQNPKTTGTTGSGSFSQNELPWSEQKDAFFSPIEVDPERADGIYPYRFVVIDVSKGNRIVTKSGFGAGTRTSVVKYQSDTGGVKYEIGDTQEDWKITLPITPQQLSVTDQFAINTSATMRGVVEEHNGVKFKIIQASGTTGIWPTRDRFEDPNSGSGISLFGGTLEALGGVARAAETLVNGSKPKPQDLDFRQDNGGRNTGYFQAQLLEQFLEQYAMAKKNPANKGWRLVFDCPKTNESFIVTPITYTMSKNQRSPGESLYNIQLKAWKRVKINQGKPSEIGLDIQALDPNFFQQLTSTLDNARSLMSASLNVVKAVRADFRKPFDALRKVTLLVKDFSGVAVALSDLPNQINKDITSSTRKRSRDLALAAGGGAIGGGEVRSRVAQSKISSTISAIKESDDKNEGVSVDDIESGENGKEARDAQRVNPVNNVFNEPEANFDFFNTINVDELELTPKQQIAIEDEIELNSLISIEEVREFVQEIQNLTLDLSNNFGAGDSFFSEVYGRPAPRDRATDMSIEEFELLASLENAVLNMNLLIATREFDDLRTQSPLEYVGGLAEDSDIPFNPNYTGKYLAPVPFGLTIEQISARYLGDPDLYNEIITLNNLRSPYIDEDGFFYDFLSNGDGRQFNIENNENLFIGQKVQISSNTIPMFTRKITAIEKITDTNYLITVDGLSDLSLLTTADNARLKAFLPGTVNSQNQIYIPSNEVINQEPRTYDIPYLNDDTLTGLSKIDWLIDDNGDVVLNSFGEVSLANGITNLIQALRMKVLTSKGGILSAPEFGLGITPGINVTDITVEEMLNDLRDMVIQDPRFEGVDKIEMNVLPPELSITISARLANGRGVFPINFTV